MCVWDDMLRIYECTAHLHDTHSKAKKPKVKKIHLCKKNKKLIEEEKTEIHFSMPQRSCSLYIRIRVVYITT